MTHVSRNQYGIALATPNGDDMLFTDNPPKFTVHNYAGVQVDGYDTKAEAQAATHWEKYWLMIV